MPHDRLVTVSTEEEADGGSLDAAAIMAFYGRWAGLYDLVFGAWLGRGRRDALTCLKGAPGKRVLEIGVGTGLSLPRYSPDARVTGIDLCPEMIARAEARRRRLGLLNVEGLAVMDGQRTAFASHSFDIVVAMYVLSVTPDPHALLAEMRRLCVQGGEIVIVNRFSSSNALVKAAERLMSPVSSKIGFRTGLPDSALSTLSDLPVIDRRRVAGLAGIHLIRLGNLAAA